MFGRAKRRREYHEAIERAWRALAEQRHEVERLLGPVAKRVVGSNTGSFEGELDEGHKREGEEKP